MTPAPSPSRSSPVPRPLVVIAEPIAEAPRDWLARRAELVECPQGDRPRLLGVLADADALIVRTYTIVDDELLAAAPGLRVVARAGVGLDNIDLSACEARGIRVVHTPRANTSSVVEYVTGMMLAALRPIAPLAGPCSAAAWHALRAEAISARSCVGATLGIVGLGNIGSALAPVAGALGMRVLYHDLREIPQANRAGAIESSLDELAAQSDVVSVHVDGRAGNRGLIDAAFFSKLRGEAVFINTSRGFVVNEPAAAAFASARRSATLVLDVFDPEPVAPDSPLLGLPNVVLTPHIASATRSAKERMSWVVTDVARVLEGQSPEFGAV